MDDHLRLYYRIRTVYGALEDANVSNRHGDCDGSVRTIQRSCNTHSPVFLQRLSGSGYVESGPDAAVCLLSGVRMAGQRRNH